MNALVFLVSNIVFLLLFPSCRAAAQSSPLRGTSSTSVTHESTNESEASALKFKPVAALSVGSTSNATLLTSSTPGTYGKVAPSITADFTRSDSFAVSSTIGASLKHFSDPTVSALADESRASAKTDIYWNLNDSWEIGSGLSFNYLQNHIPVVGANAVTAIPQRYYQPEGRVYGAWTGEKWSFEVGAAGTNRRYDTTTFDIQGNTYRNTYSEFSVDGKTGYRWSKTFKLQLRSRLERRSYQDRMAEFSDGLPAIPGTTQPQLSTMAQDNELQLKSELSSVSFSPALGLRLEKDLIYGARDSVQFRARGKISIPLTRKLTVEPEIAVSRQAFSNFRADPIDDPKNSPRRVDWETRITAALKLPVTRVIGAQAQYSLNRKLSNYVSENYLENVFETGMNMQF